MIARLALSLFLAALAALPAARAAVSPAASSDVVLAARAGQEVELRLQYQKDDGRQRQTLTVGVARDYDYLQTPTELTIHDYRLRRIFRYYPAFNTYYISDSLYADVWYRAAEVQNRSTQAGLVQEAGLGPVKGRLSLSPFWAESELGIPTRSYPRPMLTRSDREDRTTWTLDHHEVVSVRWHPAPLPAQMQGPLRRLWPHLAPVHPQIVNELVAAGRIPDELMVEAPAPDDRHLRRLRWTLSHYEWVASAIYPLPPHLDAEPTERTGVYPKIFLTLADEVAKQSLPPDDQNYLNKIESAISDGNGLEALLWQMEMRLAEGVVPPECVHNDPRSMCAFSEVARSLADSDERTAVAFAGRSPPMKLRAAYADIPNAYLLQLLWATEPPGAKVTFADSERGVLAALQAVPVANFCRNAGDFYAGAWKAAQAWQIWDLGRLMAGHRSGDLLDGINTLEASLAREYPSFF